MLTVRGLEVRYGLSQALFGVDLSVSDGEVVALMGRNGMGKTTTISAILGMKRPYKGSIEFGGKEVSGLPSYKTARLGIGLVPEGRRCFSNLTVSENLHAAARGSRWSADRVFGLFPRLRERLNQKASTLSGGEQQMLAIGRALMTNPRLLILDEATEGLAPVVRQDIWKAIRALKLDGQSILLVDKTFAELVTLVDRIFVLEKGRTVWAGPANELTAELQDRYLGV